MRHTAATLVLRKTGNVFMVKEFLGHAHLKTTQKYIDEMKAVDAEKLVGALSESMEDANGQKSLSPKTQNGGQMEKRKASIKIKY